MLLFDNFLNSINYSQVFVNSGMCGRATNMRTSTTRFSQKEAFRHDYSHPILFGKKRPQYSRHNFDQFRHSFVIFGRNHPDTSLY